MKAAIQNRLVVLGNGGHACVIADVARSVGVKVLTICGPHAGLADEIEAVEICRDSDDDIIARYRNEAGFIVGVGEQKLRKILFERLRQAEVALATLVHPSAILSPSAQIGAGTLVMPRVVVNAFAVIGAGAIVNSGAVIEHHVRIGDAVHISPGAILCGGVHIGEGADVGAGSVVLPGLSIGAGARIGAGAVVTRNVPAGQTVAGTPARPLA